MAYRPRNANIRGGNARQTWFRDWHRQHGRLPMQEFVNVFPPSFIAALNQHGPERFQRPFLRGDFDHLDAQVPA